MVTARPHDGHCFGIMALSEGPRVSYCTMNHESARIERMKTKTRTKILALSDSLMKLPKASTLVLFVSVEGDCAIVRVAGL